MKYRYYIFNRKDNVGVTDFCSNIQNHFIECLCDCIDFLTYECDDTCDYEFYIHNDEQKILITFTFVNNDGDDRLVCLFNGTTEVDREDIRDYIKANL